MKILAAPVRLVLGILIAAQVATTPISEANAALNAYRVGLAELTAQPAIHDGEIFVPLSDVSRLTQCKVGFDTSSQGYEAWPCKPGGRIAVDPAAIEGYGGPNAKPSTNGKLGDTQWFNPQPDPPRELSLGEATLSTRVLTDTAGRAWVPLVDLATALGGAVRTRRGETFIVVPRRTASRPLLRLGSGR